MATLLFVELGVIHRRTRSVSDRMHRDKASLCLGGCGLTEKPRHEVVGVAAESASRSTNHEGLLLKGQGWDVGMA